MNDCTRFNGNSSKRSRFSTKPKTFILWGPWNSAPDLLKLHPIIVQMFQCGASKMCLLPTKYCVRTDFVFQNKNLPAPSRHCPTTSSHICRYVQSVLFFFQFGCLFSSTVPFIIRGMLVSAKVFPLMYFKRPIFPLTVSCKPWQLTLSPLRWMQSHCGLKPPPRPAAAWKEIFVGPNRTLVGVLRVSAWV